MSRDDFTVGSPVQPKTNPRPSDMGTTSKPSIMKKVAVLVTTEHRGVFFGYANEQDLENKQMWLTQCRNCIYWSAKVKGFLGLASDGPNSECRIGAEAPEVLVHSITSVARCTENAAKAWTAFK